MKFKIRFADQIVGIFSIAAVVGIIVLILSIGVKQNWFAKKNHYYTIFDSGSGISVGMDLTYKGFSIGKVKSVELDGWAVVVNYYVLAEYLQYVKEDSLVELNSSPIGLGASFVLHPGMGADTIPSGSEIFRVDSRPGKRLIAQGKIEIKGSGDSISALMNKASDLLDNVNELLANINGALDGTAETPLAGILRNVEELTALLSDPDGVVPNLLGPEISGGLTEILTGINAIFADPEGAVPHLLGAEVTGEISGILANLEVVSGQIDGILSDADTLLTAVTPDVQRALADLDVALRQLQDVLAGVSNISIIRKGIPDRSSEAAAAVHLRSTDF